MHGGSKGIESQFIKKIFEICRQLKHTTLAFNFPYLEKGRENSSGPELKEEINTLKSMLKMSNFKQFTHIRLIGKSLGGIVASYYLNSLSAKERKLYEVIVLGYVTGEIKLKQFNGKITVIQGEIDKFGSIDLVKKDLAGSLSQETVYYEVKGADHSYRDPLTKEPVYEDMAIKFIG